MANVSETKRVLRGKVPPLTDAKRHARFKEMAGEVEAESDDDAFDRAFANIDVKAKPADSE